MDSDDDKLLPERMVRERFNISEMTLWRWDRNLSLGFPSPVRINGRKYRRLSEILAWERSRVSDRAQAEMAANV